MCRKRITPVALRLGLNSLFQLRHTGDHITWFKVGVPFKCGACYNSENSSKVYQ